MYTISFKIKKLTITSGVTGNIADHFYEICKKYIKWISKYLLLSNQSPEME